MEFSVGNVLEIGARNLSLNVQNGLNWINGRFAQKDVIIQTLLEGVYDESEIQEMTIPWGEISDFKMIHERDKFHNR